MGQVSVTTSLFSSSLASNNRFDMDGYKAVQSEKFLKRLTNESIGDQSAKSKQEQRERDEEVFTPIEEENPTKLETPRLSSNFQGEQLDPRLNCLFSFSASCFN